MCGVKRNNVEQFQLENIKRWWMWEGRHSDVAFMAAVLVSSTSVTCTEGKQGKYRSVGSCCFLSSFSHLVTSVFQQPSLFKINQTKMLTKEEKVEKDLNCARCLCSGCLCFKVLLLKSCTSHNGICVSQPVHVCALKAIEAMWERRKDYCLKR